MHRIPTHDARTDPRAPHGDEALREALLELQRLRQSEARAQREGAAVLGALTAATRAADPDAALAALLAAACAAVGGDAAAILRRAPDDGGCVVDHATDPRLCGPAPAALAGLMGRARRIADIAHTGWCADWPGCGAFRGLIVAPIAVAGGPGAAVLCLTRRPSGFGPDCLRLLGRIAGIAGATLDKVELAARQALLTAVIEGSSASFSIADARIPHAPLIYVNPAFEALTGHTRADALAQNCRFLAADPPDAPERRRLRAAVAGRARGHFLLRNRRKDGTLFWNQLDLDAVPAEGDAARYLVATQIDVTERVEAHAALQRMNDRLASIAAVSDTWFWECDADLRWTFLSEAAETVLGLPRAALLGRRLPDLWPGADAAAQDARAALQRRIDARAPIEGVIFRAPAGAQRDRVIQLGGTPFLDGDGGFAGYRGVAANVTEIVRAKEDADVANRAKSDFLATISHELRTPLTAILGTAEVLAPMLTTRDKRRLMSEIAVAGRRLEAVLGDVIDLARLDNGRMALAPGRFVPGDLVRRIVALHAPAARDKGIALHTDLRGGARAPRHGDAERIGQILHHLLGNAVKFTAAGRVRVGLDATDPDRLLIAVADTGIGIPPDQQDRAFDSFVQIDAGSARSHGGAGLGLAICRQLVRLMGGEITLQGAPGQGTTVRVRLPVARIAPPIPAPPPVAPDAAPLRGLHILVADDTAANRKILSIMLSRLGAACTLVPDGSAALAAWRGGAFDVGLFDINMPGLDGVALVRAIRSAEAEGQRARLPVVAVTANAMPHQRQLYHEAGFDDCVAKPFSRERLLDALWPLMPPAATRPAPRAAPEAGSAASGPG